MNGQGLEGTTPTRPPGRYRIADMGHYIALEGIEGAGKTSVQAGLRLRLEAPGREVVCVREPGGTPVGRSLRRILLDGLEPIPWAEALLFAADRAQLAAEVIRPALDRGAWVLSDRSVYSSLAYQGVGRGLGMDRIRALNELGLAGTWPDLVILLAVRAGPPGYAPPDEPAAGRRFGPPPRAGPRGQDRPDRLRRRTVPVRGVRGVRGACPPTAGAFCGDRRRAAFGGSDGRCLGGGRGRIMTSEDALVVSTTAFPASGVIGHRAVMAVLEHEAAAPAHTYLFVGPSNVGKATIALHFAAALVGRTQQARGRVMRHCHPDVAFIGPEGRTALGVDQARQAIADASLRPVEGSRKVFIFDDASTMTEAAANALLKTLEEPPAGAVFIVVAESEDDLPATVASRCRIVRFGRVSEEETASALTERGVEADRAVMTARIAGGRPGLALDLAANREVGEFRRRWLEIPGLVTPRPGDGFRLAEEMLAAHRPLLTAIDDRRRAEIEEIEARGSMVSKGDRGSAWPGAAAGRERPASPPVWRCWPSWYLDSVSAQHGGPVRNPDLAPADLARTPARRAVRSAEQVLDAVAQLRRNQRPRLVLSWLFTALGSQS